MKLRFEGDFRDDIHLHLLSSRSNCFVYKHIDIVIPATAISIYLSTANLSTYV